MNFLFFSFFLFFPLKFTIFMSISSDEIYSARDQIMVIGLLQRLKFGDGIEDL